MVLPLEEGSEDEMAKRVPTAMIKDNNDSSIINLILSIVKKLWHNEFLIVVLCTF